MIAMLSKRLHAEMLPTTETHNRNEVGIRWPRVARMYDELMTRWMAVNDRSCNSPLAESIQESNVSSPNVHY
jgi:hypothetical protein